MGVWAVENEMKINPGKSKTVGLTGDRVKDPLNYSFKKSVALVRERTIPTEWPPPVGEVSANFCG